MIQKNKAAIAEQVRTCTMWSFVCLLTCIFWTSCSSGKRVAVEQPPTPQATAPVPAAAPVKTEVARGAKLPEVQDAIKRVFKDATVLHPEHTPNFLLGDFNGDASQDLAVILKP